MKAIGEEWSKNLLPQTTIRSVIADLAAHAKTFFTSRNTGSTELTVCSNVNKISIILKFFLLQDINAIRSFEWEGDSLGGCNSGESCCEVAGSSASRSDRLGIKCSSLGNFGCAGSESYRNGVDMSLSNCGGDRAGLNNLDGESRSWSREGKTVACLGDC